VLGRRRALSADPPAGESYHSVLLALHPMNWRRDGKFPSGHGKGPVSGEHRAL